MYMVTTGIHFGMENVALFISKRGNPLRFRFLRMLKDEFQAQRLRLVWSRTNNEAERTLRSPAQARDTGRTNKTVPGARCQTVIVSVLESLRLHLSTFTLSRVIEEIRRWCETGRSCFARLAEKLGLINHGLPDDSRLSLLDRVIPAPDG